MTVAQKRGSESSSDSGSPRLSRGETAYREIRRRIVELEMLPGSAFTEGELASELGISKTPVRDALGRLAGEALVTVAPRSGYLVAPVTIEDARGLYEVRVMVEPESAALAAARGTDPDALFALEEVCRLSYDPTDAESVSRFLNANTRLHHGIALASGNPRLASIVEELLVQLERLIRVGVVLSGNPEILVHEHLELLDAVKGGDPERARAVSRTQILASQRMVVEALMSSEAVQTAVVGVPHGLGG